jgi:hypothetical protein
LAQTSLPIGPVSADEDRLERTLLERGSLQVSEAPLDEVVTSLAYQFQIPIRLAVRKLEEAGINVDVPVTAELESLPLESLLTHLFRDLELDFTVRDSVILVSTPEHLESPDMMVMRIYPVRDLVLWRVPGAPGKQDTFEADYDSLIDVITTTVEPESWSDVGGPGSIKEFEKSAAIIVSQTRNVHRQIERLLATLRKARELQGIASSMPPKAVSSPAVGRTTSNLADRRTGVRSQSWQIPRVYSHE